MKVLIPKKKKDFKLKEEIVIEFERLAPSGKQTAIVEQLIANWISEEKRKTTIEAVKRAYARSKS